MSLINCPECNKEISDKAKSCPHCGYEISTNNYDDGEYCPSCLKSCSKPRDGFDKCPYCKIEMKFSLRGTFDDIYGYGENHPELKESPEFSIEAYNRRINYVPVEYGNISSAKCPTCQSTNIRKIDGVERGASIVIFGLFSKKINKTFKCSNCGYTW